MTVEAGASPLDDFRALAAGGDTGDTAAREAAAARNAVLIKPEGALGRLEDIALWLASVTGKPPAVTRPRVVIFAASHGVVEAGVSPFPSSVNGAMLAAFREGHAAINQICAASNIGLSVFDLAVDVPTPNIAHTDAFESERALAATLAFGLEAVATGADCIALGEMGIGNTTVAAVLYAALFGGRGADWAGAGSGASAEGVARKAAVVDEVVARIAGERDPLRILMRVGGREIAAMVGAILAARSERVPVIVDGFVATAAAAVVHAMDPHAIGHCLFGHRSAEAAHERALDALGAVPLLDLRMRLGEGTGAALALGIVRAAAACHSGMATFAQAGVSGPQ